MSPRLFPKAWLILALAVLLVLPGVALQAGIPAAGSGPSSPQDYCSGQNSNGISRMEFNVLYQRDIPISCAPAGAKVTKVEVTVALDHDCSAELNIRLDNSHRSTFLQHGVCPGAWGGQVLNFTTTAYNGDPVNDTWKLFLRDMCDDGCNGSFNFWSIRVYYETAAPTPTRTATPTATRPGATSTPTPTATRPVQTPTATPTTKPGCDHLTADFHWEIFCAVFFTFSDDSTTSAEDPITSWQWDFGDGATSTQQNPAHTYGTAGLFDVTLAVRTQSGCVARASKPVEAAYPKWVLRKELVSPVGRPVYVGDEVTYRLVVGAVPGHPISQHNLYDLFDSRYFGFVSASPPPDDVRPAHGTSMLVVWALRGAIPAGAEREAFVTLRVKDVIAPPLQEHMCNQAWALLTFAPSDCHYSAYAPACVEARLRPSGVSLDKVLISPAGGVASVGDPVKYEIRVRNQNAAPVTLASIADRFATADYELLEALPPPDVSKPAGPEWVLIWENRTIAPGATLTLHVTLRARRPTQQALNCASFPLPPPDEPAPPGVDTLAEALDCASVAVRPLEGKHAAVDKRFTLPSNHIAKVGDWLAFETQWRNVGTETATRIDLHDAIVPTQVSAFLPLDFGFLWPFQTGDWAKVTAAFKAKATGWPAVNTAAWTATWADGSQTAAMAQDFVYIADEDVVPRGLAVRKELTDPLGGAKVGDIVTFRVTVTNITGLTMPTVTLIDTFDPHCFTFHAAGPPPDSVTASQVTWNNIGPLGPGDTATVYLNLKAEEPCGPTRNCVRAEAAIPAGPTLIGVDCAMAQLEGPERPRLSLEKLRPQAGPVAVGATFEWRVVLHNVGGAPLTTIPLADRYDPVHLRFVSASPPPDVADTVNGLLEWFNVGPLNPGQQRTIVLRFEALRPGLGVRNCAHSEYQLGSVAVPLTACDDVNLESPGPAIEVAKLPRYPPAAPPGPGAALPTVGLGSSVAFTVTVRNTGGQPLHAVNVTDHFDTGCLDFLAAPGMITHRPQPDQLAWAIGSLNPGEERSWTVLFDTVAPCRPTSNCVHAAGRDPEGVIVEHGTCVEIGIEEPDPGISVRKHLHGQVALPSVGDVLVFELAVQNTGNTILTTVPLWDVYDRDCFELAGAVPMADWHDPLAGQVHWQNLGPLLPGEGRTVYVMLRAIAACWPVSNCIWSRATDVNGMEVGAEECMPVWIRKPEGEGHRYYLPRVLK